jgi:hypothetical protein
VDDALDIVGRQIGHLPFELRTSEMIAADNRHDRFPSSSGSAGGLSAVAVPRAEATMTSPTTSPPYALMISGMSDRQIRWLRVRYSHFGKRRAAALGIVARTAHSVSHRSRLGQGSDREMLALPLKMPVPFVYPVGNANASLTRSTGADHESVRCSWYSADLPDDRFSDLDRLKIEGLRNCRRLPARV